MGLLRWPCDTFYIHDRPELAVGSNAVESKLGVYQIQRFYIKIQIYSNERLFNSLWEKRVLLNTFLDFVPVYKDLLIFLLIGYVLMEWFI